MKRLFLAIAFVLAVCVPLLAACPAHAEGPVEALDCAAKGVYWEGRNLDFAGQLQIARTFYDVAANHKLSVCGVVERISTAFKQHKADRIAEPRAWEAAQGAALTAWSHPEVDEGNGDLTYFIDLRALTRPGFVTTYAGQHGLMIFFTERRAEDKK